MRPFRVRRVLALRLLPSLVLSLVLAPALATAQSAPVAAAPKGKSWKFAPRLDVVTEYDGNVFLLPPAKVSNPGAPSAAELVSGRYDGMEASRDLVTTLGASVAMRRPGRGNRDFTLTPELAYEWYARNTERTNVAMGITLEQLLRREGRVRLRAQLLPGYFARNYLANALDANLDGTISAGERIYARGEYSETDVQADYRKRLIKSSAERPLGAWLTVGAGLANRTFKAPFAARDYSGLTASVRLQFDLAHGLELVSAYDLAVLGSTRTPQVMLLDEPLYGQDLNGNLNATDLNARTVRTVDRSHTEHVLGETARFAVTKKTDMDLSVDVRWRSFSSAEPFDASNNGRKDRRVQYAFDVTHRLAKGVRMYAGAGYGSQRLNRRTDLGGQGEVDDYTKLRGHVGFRVIR